MARAYKYIGYGVAIAAAVAILAGIGLKVYLQSDAGRQGVLGLINKSIPGRITWEALQIKWWPLNLAFEKVEIRSPREKPVITLDHLMVTGPVWRLLEGEIRIETLRLDRPVVDLELDARNDLNLVGAFVETEAAPPNPPPAEPTAEGGAFPFNVVLEKMVLTQGSVRFAMPDSGLEVTASGVDLSGSGNLAEQWTKLAGRIARAWVTTPHYRTRLENNRLQAALRSDVLEAIDIALAGPAGTARITGRMRNLYKNPDFDLAVDVDLALAAVAEDFALAQPLSGRLQGRISLKDVIDNAELGARLHYGGGHLLACDVPETDVNLHLKDRQLTLDKLDMRFGDGRAVAEARSDLRPVFPQGFLGDPFHPERLSYDIRITPRDIPVEALCGAFQGNSGLLTGNLHASGTGVDWRTLSAQGRATLEGQRLRIGDMAFAAPWHMDARLSMAGGKVQVSTGKLTYPGLDLETTGALRLDTGDLNVRLSAKTDQHFVAQVDPRLQGIGGRLQLLADVGGTVSRPLFEVDLNAEQLRLQERTLGDGRLHARLDDHGILNVTNLDLQHHDARIQGKGRLQIYENGGRWQTDPSLSLALQLTHLDPAQYIPQCPVSTRIDGTVRLSGALTRPRADTDLTATALTWQARDLGDMHTRMTLEAGKLNVLSADITRNRSHVSATGWLALADTDWREFREDPPFQLEVDAEEVHLNDFLPDIQGRIHAAGRLTGTITNPSGDVQVSGRELLVQGQTISTVAGRFRIHDRRVDTDDLHLRLSDTDRIDLKGHIGFDGAFACDLHAREIALEHVAALQENTVIQGTADLRLSGDGTLAAPTLHGRLNCTDLAVEALPVGDIQLTADMTDGRLRWQGDIGPATTRGDLDWAARALHAEVQARQLDLAPYFELADASEFSGWVSGALTLDGDIRLPDRVKARMDISEITVFHSGSFLAGVTDLHGTYDAGAFNLPETLLTLAGSGRLQMTAKGHYPKALHAEVNGLIPLNTIGLFQEDLAELKGDAKVAVVVSGAVNRPDIRGRIDLKDAAMVLPETEQHLQHLNGRILIQNQTARFEQFKGQLDTGRFELAGTLEMDGFKPARVDADLKAYALPLVLPDTLALKVNADVSIRGTPDDSKAQGKFVLLEGLYYKDVALNLIQGLTERRREVQPPDEEIELPYLRNLSLDILVEPRHDFVVDNNLAKMAINPDVRILGTLAHPIVRGRTQVTSGTVTYQNKTFVIEKGVIDFINPYKTVADLDIRSRVKVREWTITLEISGPLDDLLFKLSSDPYEEDSDILSLLLLNKTNRELAQGENGGAQSPRRMLAELLADTYGEDIKAETGLDILEVKSEGSGEASDPERISLTMGKELSRRLTLKYAVEAQSGETRQKAIAEYKFLEHILLNGFQDNRGAYGGEVQYRYEFR